MEELSMIASEASEFYSLTREIYGLRDHFFAKKNGGKIPPPLKKTEVTSSVTARGA